MLEEVGRAGLPVRLHVDGEPFAIVFFAGTFGLNFQMTSALMATQVFHKGAGEYGLLGSIMAVGSRWAPPRGSGTIVSTTPNFMRSLLVSLRAAAASAMSAVRLARAFTGFGCNSSGKAS